MILAHRAALLTLSLVSCSPGPRELSLNQPAAGRWEPGDSMHAWVLEQDSAAAIMVELTAGDSGEVDVGLTTNSGDTAWASTEYGTARLVQRMPGASGLHIIALRRGRDPAADYRLVAHLLDGADESGDGWVAIAPGRTVHGLLEARDQGGDPRRYGRIGEARTDLYAFPADSGSYAIVLRSPDFDAQLALMGAGGRAHDDDGAGGTDAKLNLTVREADTVRLIVSSLASRPRFGRYTLSVERTAGAFPDLELMSADALTPAHRVCEGKPIGGAPRFDSARAGLHSVVLVGDNVFGGRQLYAAEPLHPDRLRSPELVLCLARQERLLQTCSYQGPQIRRVQNLWRGRLVESHSASQVGESQVEGSVPRPCAAREPMTLDRLGGSLEGPEEAAKAMFGWLGRYVGMDSAQAASLVFRARDW